MHGLTQEQFVGALFLKFVDKALPLVFIHCHPEWRDEVVISDSLQVAMKDNAAKAYTNWLVEIGAVKDDAARALLDEMLAQSFTGGRAR